MADNYLENKMEALRQGPKIIKRPSVSVEGLLKSIQGQHQEPGEAVMSAQLEAIVRAGRLVEEAENFRFEFTGNSILLLGPGSPRKHLVEAGEILMAMRMKAAELHLCSSAEIHPESTAPANPLIATLKVWK